MFLSEVVLGEEEEEEGLVVPSSFFAVGNDPCLSTARIEPVPK